MQNDTSPTLFEIIKSHMNKKAYEHKCSLDRTIFDIFKTNRCMIESFGSYYTTILSNRIDNKFWRDSLLAFHEYHTNIIY